MMSVISLKAIIPLSHLPQYFLENVPIAVRLKDSIQETSAYLLELWVDI